jgi:hypothetical protein
MQRCPFQGREDQVDGQFETYAEVDSTGRIALTVVPLPSEWISNLPLTWVSRSLMPANPTPGRPGPASSPCFSLVMPCRYPELERRDGRSLVEY